jgi:hypothetical protein
MRLATATRHLAAASAVVLVGLYTVAALTREMWDDALFFKRIGVNLVDHGTAAWNVADGPVHGSTSQLFQMVAACVVALARDHYIAGIRIVLGACLAATFFVLVRCAGRLQSAGAERGPGPGATAVILCGLASPIAVLSISNGMETMLAMLAAAVFFLVLARLADDRGSWGGEVAAFVAAHLLVYLARPDVSMIAFIASAIVLYDRALPPWRQTRLIGLCAAALAGIAVLLVAFRLYYGTAFPLSFYLKVRLVSIYDTAYQDLDLLVKRRHLITWLALSAPFVFVALWGRSRWTAALLASAGAFVAYHYFSTVEIMGYHGRFYLPALVPVVLAAALAWPRLASSRARIGVLPFATVYALVLLWLYQSGWIEAPRNQMRLARIQPHEYAAYLVPLAVLLAAALWARASHAITRTVVPLAIVLAAIPAARPRNLGRIDDARILRYSIGRMSTMRGLYEVKKCLPEPINLYHSELGAPGALFLDSRITDLSGLMNRRLVFEAPPFDEYCLADPPDVLFMPHKTHARLNREIRQSRCFRQFTHPPDIRRSPSTIYIRNDLLPGFRACTNPTDRSR